MEKLAALYILFLFCIALVFNRISTFFLNQASLIAKELSKPKLGGENDV
jgi:hypothetical protein